MLQTSNRGTTSLGRPVALKLGILVLSVLLPAILLTSILLWRVSQLDGIRANQQALQLARSVAVDLDREIDGSIETLLALATSPALKRDDLAMFHAQARETLSFRRLNALLKTPDGQQLMNTRLPFGSSLPRQVLADYDRDVLISRKPAISVLLMGSITRTWVVGLSVPVVIDDQVRYILTMSIDPEHIQKIIAQAPRDPEWVIAISDSTGRLIARSDEHASYVGRIDHPDVKTWSAPPEGIHRTPSLDGSGVLRGYRWSTTSGWLTAAFVPTTVIDAPLRRVWEAFAILAIALMTAVVPLTLQLGRQIAAPIEAAASDARRLGQGQLIDAKSSYLLEANELSNALATASAELRDRTRALTANERRFRSVFEQSAVGFEQVDLDGRMLGVNERLCKLLGYTREECQTKTFKTLTHPEDFTAEESLISQLLKRERDHYTLEKRMISKSGEPVWVRVTSALVRDDEGHALHRASVVEDVTERRRVRAEAARLAAIVQASRDAMISTSLEGTIETWNPGAAALFGYTRDEAAGQSLEMLVPESRKHELREKLSAVSRGKNIKLDTVRLHKDGTAIDVSSTAAPITAHGVIESVSVIMEDIRERKAREAQVVLLNRELAHRVKNTLAVIQSIANQTMRSTPAPEAFRMAFQGRLQSLAGANDLLMLTGWRGTELGEFIDRQLAPLMPRTSRQLIKNGPEVLLPADLSIPLGLALNELGTNAIKYGAWSTHAGAVHLTWTVRAQSGETHLVMTWKEAGGPAVTPPVRRGFGTTIIERGIPNAEIARTFAPSGMICTIDLQFPC